jgi:CRP-like cAMP-binding protein
MIEEFKSYLLAKHSFSDESLEHIMKYAIAKKVKKRQFLLHEGEVARYKCFIVKGFLRLYRIRQDGSEHILKFGVENWWLTDMESYDQQSPSQSNIDALEDSEVLLWTKENFERLLNDIPDFKEFSDKLITKSYSVAQNRLFSNLGFTAEEKYEEFIKLYPDIFNRMSLQLVASFLGISRETLSRIRNAKSHR